MFGGRLRVVHAMISFSGNDEVFPMDRQSVRFTGRLGRDKHGAQTRFLDANKGTRFPWSA